MINSKQAFAVGVIPGLALSYLFFNNVSWYHDYYMWQLQHPMVLIPAALIGLLVGYLSD